VKLQTTVAGFVSSVVTVEFTITYPRLVNALVGVLTLQVATWRTFVHIYTHPQHQSIACTKSVLQPGSIRTCWGAHGTSPDPVTGSFKG